MRVSRKMTKLVLFTTGALLLFGAGVYGITTLFDTESQPESLQSVLSASTSTAIPFPVYYFENDVLPHDLQLVTEEITYSQGLVFYSLQNDQGGRITVSQQRVPATFSAQVPQGDENFSTPYGKATVSTTADGRLVGSLLTEDDVFVLLNSSGTVEIDTLRDVLRLLTPSQLKR